MKIGDRLIGEGQPCYIVAEISANHNQNFENAEKIIHAAKKAGADAVKLQTYTPETMTLDCEREDFQIPSDSIWSGKKLFELYAEAYTPWDWHPKLQRVAHDCGLDFFQLLLMKPLWTFWKILGSRCLRWPHLRLLICHS